MLFEVLGADKQRKMYTNNPGAIPDKSTLKILSTTGYKFKYNGSSISVNKLIEALGNSVHLNTTGADEPVETIEAEKPAEIKHDVSTRIETEPKVSTIKDVNKKHKSEIKKAPKKLF